MRILKLVVAVCSAAFSTNVAAETATSGKWFCRAERLISCDAQLNCRSDASRVALNFDLDTLTYSGLSVGTAGKLIVISKGSYGPSYSTGPGSLIEIGDKNENGNRIFRLVALIGPRTNIHMGECNQL